MSSIRTCLEDLVDSGVNVSSRFLFKVNLRLFEGLPPLSGFSRASCGNELAPFVGELSRTQEVSVASEMLEVVEVRWEAVRVIGVEEAGPWPRVDSTGDSRGEKRGEVEAELTAEVTTTFCLGLAFPLPTGVGVSLRVSSTYIFQKRKKICRIAWFVR